MRVWGCLLAAGLLAGCETAKPAARPAAKLPPTPAPFVAPNLADNGALKFDFQSRSPVAAPEEAPPDAATKAGYAALDAKDYKRSIAEFGRALAADPANASALWGRAYAHWQSADPADAETDFDAAVSHATGARRFEILKNRSDFYFTQKRYDLALADLAECLKADPRSVPLREVMGYVYGRAGQADKAYAELSEAIRLAPDSANTYGSRAAFLANAKRYDEALADLSEAIVLDPSIASAFFLRADVLAKTDKQQAAYGDLLTALRIEPDNQEILNGLAWFLATCPEPALRDGKKAVGYATRACELGGWKDGYIIDTLAAALAETGNFKLAVQRQREAVALSKIDEERKELERHLALYKEGKPYREARPDPKAVAWETLRYETFETVWQTVNDVYFDPTFGGVDWAATREAYRQKLDTARDIAQLRALLGHMLAELRKTHFAVVPREGAVFNPSERVRVGSAGAELTTLANRPAIASVRAGSSAAQAGLRAGDVVVSVNGNPLDPAANALAKAGFSPARISTYLSGYVDSFLTSAVGNAVTLGVVRAGGGREEVKITCGPTPGQWSEPIGYFPSMPIRVDTHRDGDDVAVIKFNIFVPPVMRQIRAFMRTVGPGMGLVIDLRGNGGGITLMAAGICGLLYPGETSLGTMHTRDSSFELEVYPAAHLFDGPVAILVDARSASTSEMFAAGMRDLGRARIFGERSPGMALPSLYKVLPTGDLFQYALADFTTPRGVALEGIGIEPDVVVAPTSFDLAGGRDPVLEAAEAWIRGQLPAKKKGPE